MNNEFDRIERLAQRDAKRLTTEKPKIEEISPKETYLLDQSGHRLKRICGKLDEEGWPCCSIAGQSTLHEGVGRCHRHESGEVGKKEFLGRYLETLSSESELTEFFKKASIAEEDFFNVETIVRMLSSILHHYITAGQFNWSDKKIDRFLDILELYRKLIETQQKKEINKLLASSITIWLRGVLGVVFNNVSPENYSKIVGQISGIELPKEIEEIQFEEIK
jgi:hypothetical protein